MYFTPQPFRYNEVMKIEQSIALKEKIIHLGNTRAFNIALANQLIDFVLSQPPLVSTNHLTKLVRKKDLSIIDGYQSLLFSKLNQDPMIKKNQHLLSLSITPSLYQLDHASYVSNPYYQRVKPPSVTKGKWRLGYETYAPFQGVLMGDVVTSPVHYYLESTPMGYFLNPFYYLVIKQNDVTWMSVTPFEINTMAPILDQMAGKVVTLGLGLGYFASMAALKPNVNEVLVVEKDKQVIEIFMNHIYPNLLYKEKINILQQDAFDYLKTNSRPFDHLFVDIHHTAEDGLPMYIRMKKLEKKSRFGHWHYWLESSILSLFRRYMITFLQEQSLSFDESKYQNQTTLEDHLYAELFEINKQGSILSLKDLDEWLCDRSIKSILSSIRDHK